MTHATPRSRIGTLVARIRRDPRLAIAVYPFAWVALFTASSSSWFFPAGLRVAALWLVPARLWPVLAAAEWSAIAAITPVAAVHSTPVPIVAGIVLPWLIYAAAVREVKRIAMSQAGGPEAYWMPFALIAGLVGAACNGLLLTGLRWLDDETVVAPVDMLLTFALGDYAGVIALAPLLVFAAHGVRGGVPPARRHAQAWAIAPVVGLMLPAIPASGVSPAYAWFPVATPLVLIGALCSARTTVLALSAVAAAMVVVHDALPGWDRTDVQRILAVSGTAALLLAARRDAMHLQRHRLSSSIEELQLKTQALRDVATRISSQRESESRALGLELHDEVGQDMTALATRLRIAERTTADENARDELRALQAMVAAAHDHLRSVIRHLHPIALERFGLRRALCDGPLSEIAEDAGIAYRCDVEGPVEDLPLDVATAIYRICQEAVTNGIRHGCGEEIVVSLTLALAAPAPRLALTISDRAGAIDATPSRTGGLGLQGIRDRAHALGARYRFDPSAGAPRHRLELGLRMPDGPRPPGGATAA